MRAVSRRVVIAALAAAVATPAAAAETVVLAMSEYRFKPSRLSLRVGVSYRLLLRNHGRELHEFTAPAFLKAVVLGNPEVLAPGGGEVSLHPGEHKEVLFRTVARGRYPLSCADHDWAGMTGEITVR